jgi:hypothetical protein
MHQRTTYTNIIFQSFHKYLHLSRLSLIRSRSLLPIIKNCTKEIMVTVTPLQKIVRQKKFCEKSAKYSFTVQENRASSAIVQNVLKPEHTNGDEFIGLGV